MTTETKIKLLIAAGNLAAPNRESAANERFCSEALALAREIGDRPGQAWALTFLGGAAIGRPEACAEGVEHAEAGLAIFRELGDQPGMAQALNMLGELARTVGDYGRAREVYEECLVISQKTGEKMRQAMSSGNLGYVAFHEGDFERARDLNASRLKQMYEIGANLASADGLAGAAGPLARLGEPIKAARLLGAADALIGGLGIDHQMGDEFEFVTYAAEVRAMLDEATFETAFAEGQAMSLDEAVADALDGLD
jgi:tetratricopeptide (TPR) repeat protein